MPVPPDIAQQIACDPSPSEPTRDSFDEARIDRFGFGRNWLDYHSSITAARVAAARADIEQWLGKTSLRGMRVLDIGSGSGVHSACLHAMGATELVSFDYDADSVHATSVLHERAGSPDSWTVKQGSVLDRGFLDTLGQFELVYSWGVLHHTGQLWKAIDNAASCVGTAGSLFISIYSKGPTYAADLSLKRRYHAASLSGKRRMEFDWIAEHYRARVEAGLLPEGWWTEGRERGMDAYYDLVDWLGGLPFEVATLDELSGALRRCGIATQRARESNGGCHILVGSRLSDAPLPATTPSHATAIVRYDWPQGAPVVWVGALDVSHAPDKVVALAHRLPQLQFVMLAAGFAALNADTRRSLASLAPNLRVVDHPAAKSDVLQLLLAAGAVVHTADAGPSSEWIAMVARAGVPLVSLYDDAARTLEQQRCGVVANGSIDDAVTSLDALRRDPLQYSRYSLAAAHHR